jgi:TPP-dependent pyruvate/acetoin dehydrogenase alpha subunit
MLMASQVPSQGNKDISEDVLLDIFRRTMTVSRADEKMRSLLMAGEIKLGYYNVRGQEVLAGAAMAALRKDDYLVTTYRGMHDELAKGTPPRELWAEYLGRSGGTCRGKGGPMHITDVDNGVMVTTGIVGSGLPIATGLALASQMRGEDRVTIVCFGDGATNIGSFHEALNIASVWKLPVIFLCQNNRWAEHTDYAGGTAAPRIIDRAPGYGMKAARVDGNDAIETYIAVREAAERARAGEGPTLVEAMTYRILGHTFGVAPVYFTKEYKEEAKAADPLPRFHKMLADRGVDQAKLAKIDEDVKAELEEAVAFALASPYADTREIYIDVLKNEIAA